MNVAATVLLRAIDNAMIVYKKFSSTSTGDRYKMIVFINNSAASSDRWHLHTVLCGSNMPIFYAQIMPELCRLIDNLLANVTHSTGDRTSTGDSTGVCCFTNWN
jgi:hypothetical protein